MDETIEALLVELSSSAQILVDGLRAGMRNPWQRRPLCVLFPEDPELNASASAEDLADYIRVNTGAVARIYGAMLGMLSLPTFMPDVGDASLEETPDPPLCDGFPAMPLSFELPEGSLLHLFVPNCERRFTFAMQLASMAMHFLVLHEIGHVLAGHLDVRNRPGSAARITEVPLRSPQEPGELPLAVRECDADAFATHVAAFVDLRYSDDIWCEICGWNSMRSGRASFVAHAAAVSILFHVLSPELLPDGADSARYPHPAVRSNLVVSRSFSLALLEGKFQLDDLPELIQDSVHHVEETWSRYGLPGSALDPTTDRGDRIARLSTSLGDLYEEWQPAIASKSRVPARWHGAW